MALTDFLRAPSKKSLLAMLKKADKLTPRLLDKLFEGVLFKSELRALAGSDYVQLPYLTAAPSNPSNGMMWMESDGLHIYYAGAEKVVAGV